MDGYYEATVRHTSMLSRSQQKQIRDGRVAVAGVGGVGGVAALLCAKAGFGLISVCDFDEFEVANIVEQEFADYATVGRKKVVVAAEALRRHGHACEVRALDRKIESVADAKDLMRDADFVISAVDNGMAKIVVDRAANELSIPVFLAANLGWIVFHLAFMPGGFRYEHIYEGLPGVEELSETALQFIEQHHLVFFACMGHFPVEYFRRLLTGEEDHLRYMAPHAYVAASLAVNDLIKHATGRGPIVVAPESFAYDMLHNRVFRMEDREQGIREITEAALLGEIDRACQLYSRQFSEEL